MSSSISPRRTAATHPLLCTRAAPAPWPLHCPHLPGTPPNLVSRLEYLPTSFSTCSSYTSVYQSRTECSLGVGLLFKTLQMSTHLILPRTNDVGTVIILFNRWSNGGTETCSRAQSWQVSEKDLNPGHWLQGPGMWAPCPAPLPCVPSLPCPLKSLLICI